MSKTPAIFCLDIEDPITMRSHLATEWICSDITAHGITASCFLVAEKLRQWERLGLRSVIEAVKRHALGFHSSRHSFHPAISETSEALPAREGAKLLWAWESIGWDEANRIMGKPLIGWGRTGGSWSPALGVMLGQHGHPLMYGSLYGDEPWRPCWVASALNFCDFFGGMDGYYHDDGQFRRALGGVKETISERLAAGAPYLGLFGCHPTRVVHHEFWDRVNFGDGRITPPEQWQEPPAITPEQEQTARKNYNEYLAWVAADERFEVIGFTQLVNRFSAQKPGCTSDELLAICERTLDEQAVIFTDSFSAAEIMAMMLQHAVDPSAEMLVRMDMLGPDFMPVAAAPEGLCVEETLARADAVLAAATAGRYLPDSLTTSVGTLSIADYFVALADALLKRDREEAGQVLCSAEGPYPAIGDTLAERATERIRGWTIHRPDLDTTWIERDTRLLSWTFKPAWTVDELARVEQ